MRMRHRVLVVSVLAITVGLPFAASAEQPPAADRAVIEDCLKQREANEQSGEGCIDALATPCLDKPESYSTQGQADCFRREHAVWDAMLNEHYKEVRTRLNESQKKALRDVQRAWIASRDKTCGFYHEYFEGGTMAIPMGAACLADETARRALYLKQFIIVP